MKPFNHLSFFFAGASCLIALSALLGWVVDSHALRSAGTGVVPMNPMTAVSIILASLAVPLQLRRGSQNAGRLLGFVVAGVGVVKLFEVGFGIETRIDRLLFDGRLGGNRMAPNTAAGLALVGFSLVALDVRLERLYPGEMLAACVAALSLLCLVGYAFGAGEVYGVIGYVPMAANTALALAVLAVSILCSRPDRGMIASIMSTDVGGNAARRLLPVATILPIALGWLRMRGQYAGYYDTPFGAALMVTFIIVLFTGAICWTATALNRSDAQRRIAQGQLTSTLDQLEQRIALRTAELQAEIGQRRSSEARFQSFMDNSPAVAFIKDEAGRCVYTNRTMRRRFELPDFELPSDRDLLSENVIQQFEQSDRKVLETGEAVEVIEQVPLPDGTPVEWLVYKFRISDSDGEYFIGGEAFDLTERRQAEAAAKRAAEDLQQREDQLRQAQKMEAVGTLAGGVAHEFNNLLQAIQAYTRFGMEGLEPTDQRCLDLQQALTASDRAAVLTRQLLGFGRRQALELQNVEPNGSILELVQLLRPLIGANISVEVSLAEGVGAIHADPAHFQQLMMNLCINARDAMPDGGTLFIKTEDVQLSDRYCNLHPGIEPGHYLAISVSDTGVGMPPEVVEHVFEPFFTTKEVDKGTGLGLSMVYGVVQQHKGTICVYSEVGMGTTFKIYLPTIASTPSGDEPGTIRPVSTGGTETILVAEDEPLVRELYNRILGKAGYRLHMACNGDEALRLFEAHAEEIDLLVLDAVMPHHSGREVHRQIQAVRPDIPVIFCSGYDPETAHVRFIGENEHPFLQKPFDPDVLLTTIRQAFDREALCTTK